MPRILSSKTALFLLLAVLLLSLGGVYLAVDYSDRLSLQERSFLTQADLLEAASASAADPLYYSALRPAGLIEQDLAGSPGRFRVLTSRVEGDTYRLAFSLENHSSTDREFTLLPAGAQGELSFHSLTGQVQEQEINYTASDVRSEPLEELYDTQNHRQLLQPELRELYDRLETGDYEVSPLTVTLPADSTFLAVADFEITADSRQLNPAYLLVHGSAGGAKDPLHIIDVHSSPQTGEDWRVRFETNGVADLSITPQEDLTILEEFRSLYCGDTERSPEVEDDAVFYPDWRCEDTATVVFRTDRARERTLIFEFAGETASAYNDPGETEPSARISGNVRIEGDVRIEKPPWACGDTFTDERDGTVYTTVELGEQCWMAENLKYLPVVHSNSEFDQKDANNEPGYGVYDYDGSDVATAKATANYDTYGVLYNWWAVMDEANADSCNGTGAPPDDACSEPVQGACPAGWHVASHYELTTLERYICDQGGHSNCATEFPYDESTEGWRGTDEGSALAGEADLWLSGDLKSNTRFGESGFDALPAGYRSASGSFSFEGSYGSFWSSSVSGGSAWRRFLHRYYSEVGRYTFSQGYGLSLRCLRD